MLVIDYSSSARDVPSSTPTPPSPSAKPNVLLPLFFPPPPNPPLLLVVSCLPLHFPVPLPPPRYDHAPLSSLITSSLHPHIEQSNETWHAHVDGRFAHSLFSSFSLPSVGGCSRRRGGVKRVGEGRGGVDLCQIKLKPPLSPHLSLDAGHSEYGFALGIRGVSIVGDWSPTTTFPPFPHFSQKSCSLSSSLTKISSLENYSLPLDRIGSKRRIRDRAIQTGVFRYVIFELSRGIIIYDETRVNRFG